MRYGNIVAEGGSGGGLVANRSAGSNTVGVVAAEAAGGGYTSEGKVSQPVGRSEVSYMAIVEPLRCIAAAVDVAVGDVDTAADVGHYEDDKTLSQQRMHIWGREGLVLSIEIAGGK